MRQQDLMKNASVSLFVSIIAEQIASCSCKMFEFEGVLCRHVLAVFKAKNVFMLPHHYILKRWTRNAKDEAILDVQGHGEMQGNSQKGMKFAVQYFVSGSH